MRVSGPAPSGCLCHDGSRRQVLRGAAAVALGWLMPRVGMAQDGRATRPVAGDLLVKVGDTTATPLTPADINDGPAPVLAWPMSPADRSCAAAHGSTAS